MKGAAVVLVRDSDIVGLMRDIRNNDPGDDIAFHAAVRVGALRRAGAAMPGTSLPSSCDDVRFRVHKVGLSSSALAVGVWSSCLNDLHRMFLRQLRRQAIAGIADDDWVVCVGYSNDGGAPDLQLGITGSVEKEDHEDERGPMQACIRRESVEECNIHLVGDPLFEEEMVVNHSRKRSRWRLEVHAYSRL